jgi:DNA-binding MarR family transcriptional regulator
VTDDDALGAWAGLLKIHAALVPLLDRELQAAHALPLTWYDVLLELNAAHERRMTMGQLGSAAVVSRTRVSRVVDELVRAGLVSREVNPADARSAYAVITPSGRARLREAAPTYLAGIQRYFSARLEGAEAATINRAFRRVLTATPTDRTR